MGPPGQDGIAYAARAGRAILSEPSEGIERVVERVVEWRDLHGRGFRYVAGGDMEHQVHERLGLSWPCPEAEAFDAVWSELLASAAERGLEVGRGAYGGWDDGDPWLARLAWCLVRHLAPE